MTISELCDIIILLGALAVAITNIYNFFAKPNSNLKSRKLKQTNALVENILKEKMPKILEEHDLQTKNKYLSDRRRCLEEIKASVLADTKDTLEEIKELNLKQTESIEILYKTSKDVLRQRIMNIYHTYKIEKRMPIHAREALDELYKDYKAENGNSYIDKYYSRMVTWETYDDEIYL